MLTSLFDLNLLIEYFFNVILESYLRNNFLLKKDRYLISKEIKDYRYLFEKNKKNEEKLKFSCNLPRSLYWGVCGVKGKPVLSY